MQFKISYNQNIFLVNSFPPSSITLLYYKLEYRLIFGIMKVGIKSKTNNQNQHFVGA